MCRTPSSRDGTERRPGAKSGLNRVHTAHSFVSHVHQQQRKSETAPSNRAAALIAGELGLGNYRFAVAVANATPLVMPANNPAGMATLCSLSG